MFKEGDQVIITYDELNIPAKVLAIVNDGRTAVIDLGHDFYGVRFSGHSNIIHWGGYLCIGSMWLKKVPCPTCKREF